MKCFNLVARKSWGFG